MKLPTQPARRKYSIKYHFFFLTICKSIFTATGNEKSLLYLQNNSNKKKKKSFRFFQKCMDVPFAKMRLKYKKVKFYNDKAKTTRTTGKT